MKTPRDERGAILVITALLMVALVIVVAIVIDLGATRSDRRGGQLASDNAAAAAGRALADPDVGAAQACSDALAYLAAGLDTAAFTVTSSRTCADLASACTASGVVVSSSPVTATSGNGRYVATVQYPVLDTSPLLARTSTIGAQAITATPEDGSACDRIGVQLRTTGDKYFGGIVDSGDRTSTVHAVAYGKPGKNGLGIPAFVMLERVDCGSLVENNAAGIYVKQSLDNTEAGAIHADSYATGDCGGNTKGYVVYGTSQSDGTTSIRAEPSTVIVPPATAVVPGSITVAATNGKAGAVYPTGINVEPTPGANVVSRAPVDKKYNSTGSTEITDLHTSAYAALSAPIATTYTAANGWTTYTNCNTDPPASATKVFYNCAFGRTATFAATVTDLVFSSVSLGNNATLTANGPRVSVRGAFAVPQGTAVLPNVRSLNVGGGVSVGNTGRLAVGATDPATECPTTLSTTATRFVIFGGNPSLSLGGTTAMCRTTVYLAGPLTSSNSTYTRQERTGGVPHPSCTNLKPCPKKTEDGNTATGATFSLGGGTLVNWSAPNAHVGSFSGTQGVEDLALWMEGSADASMGSNAQLVSSGVLFAPNARLNVRSPSAANPRDAQFIARSLWLYQGNLTLRPTAGNVVEVPTSGKSSLIR